MQDLRSQHQVLALTTASEPTVSEAVITLDELFRILSAPGPNQIPETSAPVDFNSLLTQQGTDVNLILTRSTTLDTSAQGQAHSLLSQDSFFAWVYNKHPDMLLVDGNIRDAALGNISPMSLLCANFIFTMVKLEPENVFTYFYCGLHTEPDGDDVWYGPSGLVRSVIIQVLLALGERQSLNLDFVNRRNLVKRLESHDLDILCKLLRQLVSQFSAEMAVYCIIDGVSKFDVDYGRAFESLRVVISYLQNIVEDDRLVPKFKVLITVPSISSARLRELVDDSYYVTLSSSSVIPRLLSADSIGSAVARPTTPLIDSSKPPQQEGITSQWGGEEYDDGD